MGRPRKRRLFEDASLDDAAPLPVENVPISTAFPEIDTSTQPDFFAQDHAFDFLDPAHTSLDYLNLLPYDLSDTTALDPQLLLPHNGCDQAQQPLNLGDVDLLDSINFDDEQEPDPLSAAAPSTHGERVLRFWQSQLQPQSQIHNETSDRSSSPSSGPSNSASTPPSQHYTTSVETSPSPGFKPVRSIECGCLSVLYRTLESLSRLPSDIPSAVRIARRATEVAHQTIRCPVCGDFQSHDPLEAPPIQCYQNMMLVVTLIPSACNAYAMILDMIDKETDGARRDGRQMWFSFQELGGLMGSVGEHDGCASMRPLNNRPMEPGMWRTTMRAILRLDVYGHHPTPGEADDFGFQSQGLKDVVTAMEDRSRKRHALMDKLLADGKTPHDTVFFRHDAKTAQKLVPEEERSCMRVLDSARLALEHLVIA
ncbi:uncharacterized protein J7T54_006012 [Emericellopsis cladophorae]|uniref:Uncharacterized protein n=1 Tax=Emericellopsis cladophorae TaxID=2686198 RepID=A0A9P9Y9N5_9HYPO|nr:uncharacterized protein J7T54_006012 [Emericellopsis cladophorae]KAI6785678.1 hypothetical protein J7T54_006012 [Emericellopsis cladophorae]